MKKTPKKPITKRPWFWAMVAALVLGGIAGASGGGESAGSVLAEPGTEAVQSEPSSRFSPADPEPSDDPEENTEPWGTEPSMQEPEPLDQEPKASTQPTISEPQKPEESEQSPVQTHSGPEPELVVTPEPSPAQPPRNTNADGKERRDNWQSGYYLGSLESDKYHDFECRAAANILLENEVWFESEEAARAAGYSRCGICWR